MHFTGSFHRYQIITLIRKYLFKEFKKWHHFPTKTLHKKFIIKSKLNTQYPCVFVVTRKTQIFLQVRRHTINVHESIQIYL